MNTFGKMAGGCFAIILLGAIAIGALVFVNRDAIGDFTENAKNLYAEVEQIQTDLPQKLPVDAANLNYAWDNGVTTLTLQVFTSQARNAEQTQALAKDCARYVYQETSVGKKAQELTVTISQSSEASNAVQTTSFTYSEQMLSELFPASIKTALVTEEASASSP